MFALSFELSPSELERRARRRRWFARFLAALHAARMRRAREVIAQHRHLLPRDFEIAGDRLNARSEDQLPFIGRD